jgi:hypothetical protein
MRRILCLAVVLSSAGLARADEAADMKALIDRAIKAAGGEARLAKFTAETFKLKGKWYGMGEGIDYTGEWAMQWPNKMRVQIDAGAGDMKFTFVRVVNGDKVWTKLGDETKAEEDKEEIAEAKDELYSSWVTTLLPLKGKGFRLAPLGEIKVEGKPAVGVRVSHKGQRDINLFFAKDKWLLVKTEQVVKDTMAGGKEVTQEEIYSDYKEVSGVQVPMKVVINRDGKKYLDGEVTEVELKEKLDHSLFGKP